MYKVEKLAEDFFHFHVQLLRVLSPTNYIWLVAKQIFRIK